MSDWMDELMDELTPEEEQQLLQDFAEFDRLKIDEILAEAEPLLDELIALPREERKQRMESDDLKRKLARMTYELETRVNHSHQSWDRMRLRASDTFSHANNYVHVDHPSVVAAIQPAPLPSHRPKRIKATPSKPTFALSPHTYFDLTV